MSEKTVTAPDPRLGEIEARLAAITPGPWDRPLNTRYRASVTAEMPKGDPTSRWKGNVDHEGNPERVSIVSCPIWSTGEFFRKQSGKDLDFIAHAPTDLAYLFAELRTAREALARVEAVAAEWEDLAGSGSDWERVYGKQKVSVEFAVSRIRAAIADPADPSTDPDGVALVEAIIERKAQDNDRS